MKNLFWTFLARRLIQYFSVIFVGLTLIFILPRLVPTFDPVEASINRLSMYARVSNPEAIEQTRTVLKKLYGLQGSLLRQYINYLKQLLSGNLGTSMSAFPTPVNSLIKIALPWTAGLLLATTLISWVLGIILGVLVGFYSQKTWAKTLEIIAQGVRPIPNYIMSLLLIILFSYLFPIFPSGGAFGVGEKLSFELSSILTIIKHAFLPAFSLLIIGFGGWLIGSRTLVSNVISEDYIVYAESLGINKKDIMFKYIMRNTLLPQITGLALQLGMIFNGALITEIVFNYPGLGQLAYSAIFAADFPLLMGVTIYSIVAVATSVLILDLIYPLFDPRIQYK